MIGQICVFVPFSYPIPFLCAMPRYNGPMIDIRTPPSHPLVGASILSADFGHMADECRDVLNHGADLLHVDIMDGHFVPNLTMGADMCRTLRKHFPDVYLDVHLMVDHPGRFTDMFADAGANLLSFHLEVSIPQRADGEDPAVLIDRIHARGMDAGLVINPPTGPQDLEPHLDQLELVLVMSVNPGWSGQKFIAEVLPKVRWLRERMGSQTRLGIDGGLNVQTAPAAVAAGADVLMTASTLFSAADRRAVIEALHTCSAEKGP